MPVRPFSTQSVADRRHAAVLDTLTKIAASLEEISAAHDALDVKFEELHYRLLFTMQITRLRKRAHAGVIVAGGPEFEEASLYEFFLRDGARYIAALKEQQHAIEAALSESASRDAAEAAGESAASTVNTDDDARATKH